jgi:ribosomal-protein-alanine N-acetyltransferase
MLLRRSKFRIETERMTLRLPQHSDYRQWVDLRERSRDFLGQWEPIWSSDHLTRRGFANRVYWAQNAHSGGTALPLFLIRRDDQVLLGAVTVDNIRRGPAQAATIGYWIGAPHARKGYMAEALRAIIHHCFTVMDISRIESACLPENTASRGVLEKSGYKYEGVAQSYLQINGRWRNHVLYANLRADRRGRTDAG